MIYRRRHAILSTCAALSHLKWERQPPAASAFTLRATCCRAVLPATSRYMCSTIFFLSSSEMRVRPNCPKDGWDCALLANERPLPVIAEYEERNINK